MQWGVSVSDEQALLALSAKGAELAAPETHLDALLHMLRAEELSTHVSAEPLIKAAALCRHLATTLAPPPALAVIRETLSQWAGMCRVAEAEAWQASQAVCEGPALSSSLLTRLGSLAGAVAKELTRLPGDQVALDIAAKQWVRGDELDGAVETVHAQGGAVHQALEAVRSWAQAVLAEAKVHGGSLAEPLPAARAMALWEQAAAGAGDMDSAGTLALNAVHKALGEIDAAMETAGKLAATSMDNHPAYRRAQVCAKGGRLLHALR